jgi:long-chain acyl-CoA synthetase
MSDQIPPFFSVYDALCASVRRHPDKTAIVYENESFTYAELLRRVDNAAQHLLVRGIGRGVAFAAYSQNRPDLMFCYYAAAKLGAIFVPVNPKHDAAGGRVHLPP